MATNVSVYIPNVGEREMLRAILLTKGLVLGLYKNQVAPDGSMTIDTLVEMATGGGRAYARKELTNAIIEDVATADKWYLYTNLQGKAQADYNNAVLSWVFNGYDVADGATAYGVFAFCWVIPFDAGAQEIQVGDTIKGATSGAMGIVTAVHVLSGTWGAGTASGYLDIMTKSGTFQDNENLVIAGEVDTINAVPTAGGAGYAVGDILKVDEGDGCLLVVTSVNAGAVTGLVKVTGGAGLTVAAGKATTALTGAGAGCTIEVTALATAAYATSNTGATGDAHRRLMAVWAFAAGEAIDADGRTIQWDMKMALTTGS